MPSFERIQYFSGVTAATLDEAFNTLINEINERLFLISDELNEQVLTGQVQKAALSLFPTFSPASWPAFITGYVGDETSTDGSYQTVFVEAFAPIDGAFWQLMDTYFTVTCGFTSGQSAARLAAIWALALTLPL